MDRNVDENGKGTEQSPVVEGGPYSRREFLKIAALAGATVAVGGGLAGVLAACGEEETTTTTAAAGGETTTTAGATTTTAAGATTTAAAGGFEVTYAEVSTTPPGEGNTIRILTAADVWPQAMQPNLAEWASLAGCKIEMDIVPYDGNHQKALLNATQKQTAYDIIAMDWLWAGEFNAAGVYAPLNEYVAKYDVDMKDFPDAYIKSCTVKDELQALPVQPHPEILYFRKDLLEQDKILIPTTTDELLAAAKHFHNPDKNFYGVLLNGQRGQPLGQQMIHANAAFGNDWLKPDMTPNMDTPEALAAANYILECQKVTAPDLLNIGWDERLRMFAQGQAPMCYEWGARAAWLQDPTKSVIVDKWSCAATPVAPGQEPFSPMGGWALGLSKNLEPGKMDLAWRFLSWFTSFPQLKILALQGNSGMPRFSIMKDPELQEAFPSMPVVLDLAMKGQLQDWMRHAIPEWNQSCDLFGTVYHEMLSGLMGPEQANEKMQQGLTDIMKKAGYI